MFTLRGVASVCNYCEAPHDHKKLDPVKLLEIKLQTIIEYNYFQKIEATLPRNLIQCTHGVAEPSENWSPLRPAPLGYSRFIVLKEKSIKNPINNINRTLVTFSKAQSIEKRRRNFTGNSIHS